ncbi:MAG: IclR family transcriptional regulator [Actinomycetota bacterium]|nr:IclR family transcriptional regulator [Actinomycetota bacterium]
MAKPPQVLSSVRNAARLLKQFSTRDRELGVSELSRRLEIGKSTVHRLLVTLTSEHLLEQDSLTGKYRLGIAMHDLGSAVATRLDLHEAVIPPLEQLRVATQETCQVAVLDGNEVVYVERLDSPQSLRLFLEVGRRNAAHSTSTGKCLLAFLPDQELDAVLQGWVLEQKTPHTIVDQATLRTELKQIRKQGYAWNVNESELGVLSVSAPIRNLAGRVTAALSAAGPETRMAAAKLQMTQAVMEAAASASRRLGYRR